MRSTKVFGVGFHKTGTSSLGAALRLLDYTVTGAHGVHDPNIAKNAWSSAKDRLDKFDAFQDNPWPLLYRELDLEVPGSKFVLTWRDPEDWIRSVVKHFGHRSTPMREFIYGEGNGAPRGKEDIYLKRYTAHNEAVQEYFKGRSTDFLVLKIAAGDGWEKLCPFLGLPLRTDPFPHTNPASTRSLWRRVTEVIPWF